VGQAQLVDEATADEVGEQPGAALAEHVRQPALAQQAQGCGQVHVVVPRAQHLARQRGRVGVGRGDDQHRPLEQPCPRVEPAGAGHHDKRCLRGALVRNPPGSGGWPVAYRTVVLGTCGPRADQDGVGDGPQGPEDREVPGAGQPVGAALDGGAAVQGHDEAGPQQGARAGVVQVREVVGGELAGPGQQLPHRRTAAASTAPV